MKYVLYWYCPHSQEEVGRAVLPTLTPGVVRRLFGLAVDDRAHNCYIVTEEHADALVEFLGETIHPERYRYFLDWVD